MKNLRKWLACCGLAALLHALPSLPSHAHEGHSHGEAAKPAKPKTYRNVRGQVVAIVGPKTSEEKLAVTLDHEEIPGFMRAMRMTIPLQKPADAKRLKAGTKIRFDLALKDGNFLVANVKILPAKTKLKLAPA